MPDRADALDRGHRRRAAGRRRCPGTPTVVVANLPYNVSVPVLLHLLATFPSWQRGLVMVQLEVADRLVAGPGSKIYGVPSVKMAWYAGVVPGRDGPAQRVLAGAERGVRPGPDRPPSAAGDHRPPASRCSPSSTPPSPSGARCSARRCPVWSAAPAAASEVLVAAGVDPQARGEMLEVGRVRPDRRAARRSLVPPASRAEPTAAAGVHHAVASGRGLTSPADPCRCPGPGARQDQPRAQGRWPASGRVPPAGDGLPRRLPLRRGPGGLGRGRRVRRSR